MADWITTEANKIFLETNEQIEQSMGLHKKPVFNGLKPVFHEAHALDQNPGIANLGSTYDLLTKVASEFSVNLVMGFCTRAYYYTNLCFN